MALCLQQCRVKWRGREPKTRSICFIGCIRTHHTHTHSCTQLSIHAHRLWGPKTSSRFPLVSKICEEAEQQQKQPLQHTTQA